MVTPPQFSLLMTTLILIVGYLTHAASAQYQPIQQKKNLTKLYVTNDYLNVSLSEYFTGYNLSYSLAEN